MTDTSIAGTPAYLRAVDDNTIAYHAVPGSNPGVMFLGGFMSDMTGSKATTLQQHCMERGQAFVRFDYLGHGASSGKFVDGSIGRWRDDALAIFDNVTKGPQILVGSSMGGWIALLLALARPERIAGIVTVAAAADFTRRLLWPSLSADERAALQTRGYIEQPSAYGSEPYIITRHLIDEGDAHLLLDHSIPVHCPVRLLHGLRDEDVPARHSELILERLETENVTLTFIKDGDHRLSRAADLQRLCAAVDELTALAGGVSRP